MEFSMKDYENGRINYWDYFINMTEVNNKADFSPIAIIQMNIML